MQFTRLRVSGFKSFSDPVELLIEDGLTGIVGPNGCGKSNLVEALRWVMGESSARGLRGAGMDDVIFNGSAFRPGFDMAEVSLRLAGPVPGPVALAEAEEIELVRRLARGTGSSYRINGREARARDVQTMFADAGSGSRSAAIIGQGQMGQVVDARPEERRRMLEDAAGIGGLHSRRREAELKLADTEANLARLVDLLQSQEARAEALRKQAREAARYRKVSAELRSVEVALLRRRLHDAEATFGACARTAGEAEAALARAVSAASAARRDRLEASDALARGRAELAGLDAERARLGERLAAMEEAAARRAAEREELERRIAETAADHAREAELVETLAEEARQRDRERRALAARRAAMAGELDALQRRVAAAGGEVEAAEEALRRAMVQHAERTAAHEQARRDLAGLEARRDETAERLRGLAAANADARPAEAARRLEAAGGQVAAARRRLEEALVRQEELAARGEKLRARQAGRAADLAALRQRRTEASATLATARSQAEDAARRQALLDRGASRLAERRRLLEAQEKARAARRAALDLEGLQATAAATAAEARLAAERQGAAEQAVETARAALDRAQHEEQALRAAHDRLLAELEALRSVLPEGARDPLIARLRVAEGHEAALAAALGDDLLAGTEEAPASRWVEPGRMDDPALPEGTRPLALSVEGVPLLSRRLGQVGVVDPARAAALLPLLAAGQRLVSLAGDLWRWDGFVRRAGSDETALRLGQRRRLALLERQVAPGGAALDAAVAASGNARAALEALVETARAAVAEAQDARAAAQTAAAALAQAQGESRTLDARAAELAREAEALAAEEAELAQERTAVESARRALPDLAALAREADALGVGEAAAAKELKALEAATGESETASRRLREELPTMRRALEQAEALLAREQDEGRRLQEELARAEAARATLRTQLEAEAARIAEALEAAGQAARREEGAAGEAGQERRALEERLAAGRRGLGQAQEALARLQAETMRTGERLSGIEREQAGEGARREEAEARLAELGERRERLEQARGALPQDSEDGVAGLRRRVAEVEAAHGAAGEAVGVLERRLADAEAALERAEREAGQARERLAVAQAERARAAALRESAAAAMAERLGEGSALAGTEPEPADAAGTAEALEARLQRLRSSRDRLGAVNLRAAEELDEIERALAEMRTQEEEIRTAIGRLNRAIATLNQDARERLKAVFAEVERHFRDLFQRLFGGGRANLRLTSMEDPLAAGLELEAMPPGKKLQHVSLLSGGEKSLTALALVFAFFLARPSPLCILDEVDAPLDDANVERFVRLMREIAQATGTRFLAVTHHPLTMARMDRLYGVTMVERGVSRLVSVALEEAVEMRATA